MAALMTPSQFAYVFDMCRTASVEEGENIVLAVKTIRGVKDSSATVAYRNTVVTNALLEALSKTRWRSAAEIGKTLGFSPQSVGKKLQKYITAGEVETRAVPVTNTRMKLEYRLKGN